MKNSKCSAVQFSQSKQEYNRHYFSTSTCTSKLPSLKEKKWKFTSFVHAYDKCIANVGFITRCPTQLLCLNEKKEQLRRKTTLFCNLRWERDVRILRRNFSTETDTGIHKQNFKVDSRT